VTEAEWLGCADPEALLARCAGGVGERKVRLLAAAFCRRVESLFLDSNSLRVVEITEACADGGATHDDLRLAAGAAAHDWNEFPAADRYGEARRYAAAAVAHAAGEVAPVRRALRSATTAARLCGKHAKLVPAFAALARDIYPFRPVTFSPPWRTDTVAALASQMYESRDFSPMPILADALSGRRLRQRRRAEPLPRAGAVGRGVRAGMSPASRLRTQLQVAAAAVLLVRTAGEGAADVRRARGCGGEPELPPLPNGM
jgi:hypothetical protein